MLVPASAETQNGGRGHRLCTIHVAQILRDTSHNSSVASLILCKQKPDLSASLETAQLSQDCRPPGLRSQHSCSAKARM